MGFPTVRHLLDCFDITSPEMNDLLALEVLDPPQGVRSDHHHAVLACVVANSRMAGKGARSFKPADFLPEWGTQEPMSNKDILNIFRGLG